MGSVRGASSLSQVYSQLACRVGRSRPCTAPLTQGQKVEEGMLPSADIERSKFGANSSRIRTYHILREDGNPTFRNFSQHSSTFWALQRLDKQWRRWTVAQRRFFSISAKNRAGRLKKLCIFQMQCFLSHCRHTNGGTILFKFYFLVQLKKGLILVI